MKKLLIKLLLILTPLLSFSQAVVIDLSNPAWIGDRGKNVYIFDTLNLIMNDDTIIIIPNNNDTSTFTTTANAFKIYGLIVTSSVTSIDTLDADTISALKIYVVTLTVDTAHIDDLDADTITADSLYSKIADIDTLETDTATINKLLALILNCDSARIGILYVDTVIKDTTYALITYVLNLVVDTFYLTDTDKSNKLWFTWIENDNADRKLSIKVNSGDRTIDLSENLILLGGYDFYLQALGQDDSLILNETFTIGDGYAGALTFAEASRDITIYEDFQVSDGFGISLQALGQTNSLTLFENLVVGDGGDVTITADDNTTNIVMDNSNFEVENANATQRDMKIVIGTDANAQATFEGTGSINNQDVTSNSRPMFRNLDLEYSFAGSMGITYRNINTNAAAKIRHYYTIADAGGSGKNIDAPLFSKTSNVSGSLTTQYLWQNVKFGTIFAWLRANGDSVFLDTNVTISGWLNIAGTLFAGQLGNSGNCITAFLDSLKSYSPLYVYIDSVYFKDKLFAGQITMTDDTIHSGSGYLAIQGNSKINQDLTTLSLLAEVRRLTLDFPVSSANTSLILKNTNIGAGAAVSSSYRLVDVGSNALSVSHTFSKTVNTSGSASTQWLWENYKSGYKSNVLRINEDSLFFDSIATFSGKSFFYDNLNILGGDTLILRDASNADSLMIYMDGTTAYFNSENPFSFNQNVSVTGDIDGITLSYNGTEINTNTALSNVCYEDKENILTENLAIIGGDTILVVSPDLADTNLYFNSNDTNYVGKGDNPSKLGNSVVTSTDSTTLNSKLNINISTAEAIIIGNGAAGVNYVMRFHGETNDGVIEWDHDANPSGSFDFSCSIQSRDAIFRQHIDTDSIFEFTADVGVYIDGVGVKDSTIESLELQLTPRTGVSHSEGTIFYDSDTKTFSGFNDRTNVTLNFGEEQWLRVVNKSGGNYLDGQVVYLDSAQGNRPTILLAKSNALNTSQGTIAVLTEDIDDNEEGIVTTFGLVRNYNTSGFDAGDKLYLSPTVAGLITNVEPTTPNLIVRVGWALNSTANGVILVNINIYDVISEVAYLQDSLTNKYIKAQTDALLDDKQNLDADLTSLAGLSSTGLVIRTAGDTYSERTITGTTNEVTITNGDGVSGNPTISLPDTLGTSSTSIAKIYVDSLIIESGILQLSETTTPSAVTNYGKVYTKTDNKLYFQDGAGNEHEITFSQSAFGEMEITGGAAYTINTQSVWHGYTGFSADEIASPITFSAGKTASDITAYVTYDVGVTTKVTTTAAHTLVVGNIITITGTTNYNDIYEVLESVDVNNFTIDKAWDGNDDATGTYALPSCFVVGTGGAGEYKITWTAGGSAVAADSYEFGIYHEKTLDHKIPRKFPNNDIGSWSGCGIITVVDTDVLWFGVINTTGTNNIDIDEIQFIIQKL